MRRSVSDDTRELESELRSGRPEPRPEFLRDLVLRVEGVPTRLALGGPRLGAALVFGIVVLVGLAAFGGVGYARSSIASAVKSSKHAVSAVVTNTGGRGGEDSGAGQSSTTRRSDENDDGAVHRDPPSVHQFSHFVLICYQSTQFWSQRSHRVHHTVVVPQALVSHFVPAIATLGPCGHV